MSVSFVRHTDLKYPELGGSSQRIIEKLGHRGEKLAGQDVLPEAKRSALNPKL